MSDNRSGMLGRLYDQIESQVQFGDAKASLMVAGNAILLAVNGGLIRVLSGCPGDDFGVACMEASWSLGLAIVAAGSLGLSLVLSLMAARPAKLHDDPPDELFLLSHVARMDRDEFVAQFTEASSDRLTWEALASVHGKAVYATRKFQLLKRAVDFTLASLGFMLAASVVAVLARAV